MKRILLIGGACLGVIGLFGAILIGAGVYDVAADDAHSSLVYRLLETARERSIAVRADDIEVPSDLDDAAKVQRGAGNYEAMCVGCHLSPGKADTEISVGLYPAPPNLTRTADVDPAAAFWVIKHGIKASGMPAWGKRMEDAYIWDIVAFLRKLPALSAEQYVAQVAASGGHSHGGSESDSRSHAAGAEHDKKPGDHHSQDSAGPEAGENGHEHSGSGTTSTVHTHADGKQHLHKARAGTPLATVQALHEALSSGDASRVQDLLDAKVLILEAGNVERSRQEYAAHHLPSDIKFMKAVKYELERQSGDTVGDLAWVATEARLTGNRDGKPIELVSTETLVLKKSSAGWKVVHVHWSSRSSQEK